MQIRAICAALQSGPFKAKFGVAALPRHLRRRAGSHKPYNSRRFRPNAKLASKRRKIDPAADAAEQAGSVDTGEAAAGTATGAGATGRTFTNRRMRRQPAALQERFRQAAAWTEASLAASGAADGGEAAAAGGSAARQLETHVWHAKRLSMEER